MSRAFTAPRPRNPIAETIHVYDIRAQEYLAKWGRGRSRAPQLLIDLLERVPRRAVILDLGCGPGQDLRIPGEYGGTAVGLELSPVLLQYARRYNRSRSLVRADMRRLPFRSRSFDGVWAAASLIHLPKREATRVLKLIQPTLVPEGLMAATMAYGNRSGFLKRGWLPGRYVSRWRKGELEGMVRRAGWTIVALQIVTNRERRGRWINLILRAPGGTAGVRQ